MGEKKRRHHYVFQAYLKSWTNEDGKLWCIRNKKNTFCTSTISVAQKRDFYILKSINSDEIKFLKLFWRTEDEIIQNELMKHVQDSQIPFKWKKYLEQIEAMLIGTYGAYDKVPVEIIDDLKELKERVDIAINNTEEDYFCDIESETKEWIDALKNEDIEFIKKQNMFQRFYDMSVQYFRTYAIRERVKSNLKEVLDNPGFEQLNIQRKNINLDNIVHFLFWNTQTKVAQSLVSKEAHITILGNR